MAVLEDPIPLASDGRPWVPMELAIVARKALSRDPSERYATARELGKDLRGWLARTGYAVDAAELAEWMDELFTGARDRQLAIVEEAESAILELTAEADLVEDAETERAPRLSFEDERGVRSRGRSGGVWLLVVALAVLGAGAAFAWRSGQIESWMGDGAGSNGEVLAEGNGRSDVVRAPVEPFTPREAEHAAPTAPEPAPTEDTASEANEPPPRVTPPASTARRPDDDGAPTTTVGFARHEVHTGATTSRSTPNDALDDTSPELAMPTPMNGSVRIEASGGWSEVYEGDRHLGRTPLTAQLSAGPHTLRLLPFGNPPGTTQSVRVPPGTEITVRVAIRDERAPDPPPVPEPSPPSEDPTE